MENNNYKGYKGTLLRLIDNAMVSVSDIMPSDWCEQNRYMTPDLTPMPGYFSYNNSPYAREIVDCLHPSHPARRIAVRKGAQIGFSTGVIEPGIGWIISQNPGNILFLVGHDELVKPSTIKVDRMIDNSGIRDLIKSTSLRARNNESGDTNKLKQFQDGSLKIGIANHKSLRQISVQYGFIDDFESMKGDTKESGDTASMIDKRFSAFEKKMKLFYISTPEVKETSNIEPVYLDGDQRKYFIPCPCCNELIHLEWEIESELTQNKMVGMTWKLDFSGSLITESVGYTCQKCEGFFDDSNKSEWLKEEGRGGSAKWIPTAKPKRPGNYSYHLSSLYSPVYMAGWDSFVREYLESNPPNGKRIESKWQSFVNLTLGQTYEPSGDSISVGKLQENIRNYEIGIIPERLSLADGNGRIVLITCGSDLNGKQDDARLDYEIVAYSESGATYSIQHGSVGTFIKGEKKETPRSKMSYRHGVHNSVWPVFQQIIKKHYVSDLTGKKMSIFITGLDSGYQTDYAYKFADNNSNVLSLKGKDDNKYINPNADLRSFTLGKEKGNLFLVESNYTKDRLAEKIGLNWEREDNEKQPSGFMNFPTPSNGLYETINFFSHFEAEHKVIDKKGAFAWRKKSKNHENHLFDCRLYAEVAKDIFLYKIFKASKIQNGTWQHYVDMVSNNYKKDVL